MRTDWDGGSSIILPGIFFFFFFFFFVATSIGPLGRRHDLHSPWRGSSMNSSRKKTNKTLTAQTAEGSGSDLRDLCWNNRTVRLLFSIEKEKRDEVPRCWNWPAIAIPLLFCFVLFLRTAEEETADARRTKPNQKRNVEEQRRRKTAPGPAVDGDRSIRRSRGGGDQVDPSRDRRRITPYWMSDAALDTLPPSNTTPRTVIEYPFLRISCFFFHILLWLWLLLSISWQFSFSVLLLLLLLLVKKDAVRQRRRFMATATVNQNEDNQDRDYFIWL